MLGTRGVPARYGGFETCVEEVGARLAARGHDVVVYCRSAPRRTERPDSYLGMRLVHLPAVRHRALETISHTGVSVAHLLASKVDVAFMFNSANSLFVPLLRARGVPVATHVDGLEWRRAKWSGLGKAYYRLAEQMSVRWSDALIADAAGIAAYYREEFDADTVQIAYGNSLCTLGFHVSRDFSPGFVTNSHCSNVQGGVEGTEYFQPTVTAANFIGTEVMDPPYATAGM